MNFKFRNNRWRIMAAAMAIFAASTQAEASTDTTRILFIGNSFTYTYDVPGLVQGFADASGLPLSYSVHAPGGVSVGNTADGTEAHMYNPAVFDLIRSGNWDYVCVQDDQGNFCYGGCIFPSVSLSQVLAGHLKIRDSVMYYNPCARMLWFAGWAYQDGYPGIAATGTGLIDNIYSDYRCLQDTAGGIIAPIGLSWARIIDSLPATDLWGPDGQHQSLYGSYLTAAVIFATVSGINTDDVAYNSTLDTPTATALRRVAYATVTDSLATDIPSSYRPSLSVTGGNIVTDTGYSLYQWYRNDTLISSATGNSCPVTVSGSYRVVVTNAGGCSAWNALDCTASLSIRGISEVAPVMVYPNPANGELHISTALAGSKQVTLVSLLGKEVKGLSFSGTQGTLPLDGIPAGWYMVNVNNGQTFYTTKLFIEK